MRPVVVLAALALGAGCTHERPVAHSPAADEIIAHAPTAKERDDLARVRDEVDAAARVRIRELDEEIARLTKENAALRK